MASHRGREPAASAGGRGISERTPGGVPAATARSAPARGHAGTTTAASALEMADSATSGAPSGGAGASLPGARGAIRYARRDARRLNNDTKMAPRIVFFYFGGGIIVGGGSTKTYRRV